MKGKAGRIALVAALLAVLSACNSTGDKLAYSKKSPKINQINVCPSSPNCVSSVDKKTDEHYIAPFVLQGNNPNATWSSIAVVVAAMPRMQIVKQTPNYIHATQKSRFFGFVDDLELQRQDNGEVTVRSAARLGYKDFDVNRKRIETLRQQLKQRKLID